MKNPTSISVAKRQALTGMVRTTAKISAIVSTIKVSKLVLYTTLTALSVIFLFPFYWTITSSVKEIAELRAIPPTWWPQSFTLDHYRAVLWRPTFPRYMLNSLIYAGATTAVILITSSLIGFAIEKFPSKYGNILFWLIYSTMTVPFNLYIVPLFLLLVGIEKTLHIPMRNTYWGMMLPWICYPFGIFLMRQAMKGVPNDLIDAARIDGASTLRIYRMVILPLVSTKLAALAALIFLWKYDDLLWPIIVANKVEMYPITAGLLEYTGVYWIDYHLYIAAATIALAPIVLIYFILQRFIIQGIATTGLKG
jgi:multiple sugar transport system permease protein